MTKPASAPPADRERVIVEMRHAAELLGDTQVADDLLEWADQIEALAASAQVREVERPAYPEGIVTGPCVCGSWPGGECLRCEWKPAAEPAPVAQGDDEAWNDPALRAILRQSIEREFADHARIVASLEHLTDTQDAAIATQKAVILGLEASLAACRADAERLDYIERTFSGMTNRERYLPVQMIWGKGAMGRTLREACDKYMKRDGARSQP